MVVERDSAARGSSITGRQRAEALLAERDAAAAQRWMRDSTMRKGLIAERERIIVERDRQLAALDEQKRRAEELVAARERIVVERDAQIAALDAPRQFEALVAERDRHLALNRRSRSESLVVERDAQLAATNERMALAERVIGERDVDDRRDATGSLRDRTERSTARDFVRAGTMSDLREEIARRTSWRWWMSLPLLADGGSAGLRAAGVRPADAGDRDT